MASPEACRPHHLLIAGTGRAGTSFLVRYLTALGLDTHITRHGDGQWDETAQAGLENLPVAAPPGSLPYVVKSPWLSECIDALLIEGAMTIDAVVIPVRDLAEAAASRMVVERQAIQRCAPWLAEAGMGWNIWSGAPGGALYSLHPLDQARILAAGFHHLVQRLVAADVPIVFLAFPRLATDGAYAFARLRPYLPPEATEARALAAHAAVADAAKLRIGGELGQDPMAGSAQAEAIALRRSLAAQQEAARRAEAAAQASAAALATAQRLLAQEQDARTALTAGVADAAARHAAELAAMRASTSWRLTAPLRAAGRLWRRLTPGG